MARLEFSVKEEIIERINNGESLGQISSFMNLGKTTVYYYIKNIKGIKYKPINFDLSNLEIIGEVIGLFAGDGQYVNDKKRWDRRIRIHFNAKELDLIDYYQNSIKLLTGKKPSVILSNSVKIMQICSKDFCDFILSYVNFNGKKVKTIQLKNKGLLNNKLFTKGFLRALVDSDGYVRKGRKEIYFGSISKNLFDDFLKGLRLFGFTYSCYTQKRDNCSDFYKVRLAGNEVDKFVRVITPIKSGNAPGRI